LHGHAKGILKIARETGRRGARCGVICETNRRCGRSLAARGGEILAITAPPAHPGGKTVSERRQFQPVPTPDGGRTVRALQAKPEPAVIIGMRHPLSLYDALA
jgi:hypothetical protein